MCKQQISLVCSGCGDELYFTPIQAKTQCPVCQDKNINSLKVQIVNPQEPKNAVHKKCNIKENQIYYFYCTACNKNICFNHNNKLESEKRQEEWQKLEPILAGLKAAPDLDNLDAIANQIDTLLDTPQGSQEMIFILIVCRTAIYLRRGKFQQARKLFKNKMEKIVDFTQKDFIDSLIQPYEQFEQFCTQKIS